MADVMDAYRLFPKPAGTNPTWFVATASLVSFHNMIVQRGWYIVTAHWWTDSNIGISNKIHCMCIPDQLCQWSDS